jgi:hypothetical protein
MKLYHGSPFLVDNLEKRTPRGDTEFNSTTSIFLTSSFIEAALYSIARDKERNNKSWGVKWLNKKPYLILKKERWTGKEKKYTLNKIGYVYEYDTENYIQNPDKNRKSEYKINKKKIVPDLIHIVEYKDIKKHIKCIPQSKYEKFW